MAEPICPFCSLLNELHNWEIDNGISGIYLRFPRILKFHQQETSVMIIHFRQIYVDLIT